MFDIVFLLLCHAHAVLCTTQVRWLCEFGELSSWCCTRTWSGDRARALPGRVTTAVGSLWVGLSLMFRRSSANKLIPVTFRGGVFLLPFAL